MGFREDIGRFNEGVSQKNEAVFQRVVALAYESIKVGSPLTGSPGQPVDTGALRNSWQMEFESPNSALISSNMVYAPPIEYGVGRYGTLNLRSSVGGFHSRALTIAGIQRLVDHAAIEVRGDA